MFSLDCGGRVPVSTFPPIAEYGLLSNCEQSCLVAPNGSVEWLCLPRPDSPSVFGALLDRAAGLFRFGPSNAQVPQQRKYVPGTMVLDTTWQTPTGWMTVHDFLVMGRTEGEERRADYHRAPSDFGAVGALVRIATCISGRVEAMVNCAPLFGYGTASGLWSYQGAGYDAMTVALKPARTSSWSSTTSAGLAGFPRLLLTQYGWR
jgi:alpha,alpha-trehalase